MRLHNRRCRLVHPLILLLRLNSLSGFLHHILHLFVPSRPRSVLLLVIPRIVGGVIPPPLGLGFLLLDFLQRFLLGSMVSKDTEDEIL